MDITHLDATVQFLCQKGVADSTHKTYQSALRRFASFCSMYSILSPFPVSESVLCYFSSFLACQHISPQTIKTYLAGIRHMQITLGLPEPRQFSSLPRLRLVQAGIQRCYSQQRQGKDHIRLPITPEILLKLRSYWDQFSSDKDIIMVWAAAVLCFFGFFRSGEITLQSTTSFNPATHLAWGDVAVDSRQTPTMLKVHLKRSKSDQLGKGVDVFIGHTSNPLCPVSAVLSYIMVRGTAAGPFFQSSTGTPLTKSYFISEVRQALEAVGLPYKDFAGHSFRIGAATTAAKAGLEDSVIRTLGRWNSNAFLVYIRTPREQLARVSTILANA